jgi:tetratricopeptide (TPR) repeat protein
MMSARVAYAKAPQLAEANAAMGLLSAGLCQWNAGKAYFQKALEQNAAVTSTYIDYAIAILLPLGDTQGALDVLTDALEADPRSIPVRRALAHILVAHGDYDQAIEVSRGVLQDAPELEATDQTLARALYLKGRTDGARARLQGEGHWGYRGYIFAIEGRRSQARQLADANPDEPARQLLIYAGLKDVDRAVAALERAAEKHPWRALTWMSRPEIEPVLRGDARAAALRGRLFLPEGCAR